MNSPRHRLSALLLCGLLLLVPNAPAQAGSATWNLNPTSGDWTDAANWTPETVPNGPTDVATFGVSNLTDVSLSSDDIPSYELDSIVFAPGASAYTITLTLVYPLTISGAGIVNQSGVIQSFVLAVPGLRTITFTDQATAGTATAYTVAGFGSASGSDISFYDSSSAGSASFTNKGEIFFFDQATAGSATFTNSPATSANGSGAVCYFSYPGRATGGHATFVNEGATISGTYGALTAFYSSGGLDHCTVINYGASVGGGFGGITEIGNRTSADHATLIAYGGTNGGEGGVIQFSGISSGGKAEVQLFGNGRLEIAYRPPSAPTVSIGSLSGDGLATLGSWQLDVGGDNRSSTFSGRIEDGGVQGGAGASLTKSGTGRFKLRGDNTYTGGTFVNAGELMVISANGSPTGTGPVQVNEGRLLGKAFMSGPVTIGKGNGAGASFAPGRASKPGTLGSNSALTFKADGSYTCAIDSGATTAAQAVGNGVTIDPAAQFSPIDLDASALAVGTIFTVINNTSTTAIAGTFGNLSDGGTITIGNNTFQANYEGGDGNDLTLTVVP